MIGTASSAVTAFNVAPDETARALADERQVEVRRYDIIYKVTDDIRATLEGKLKPEEQKVDTGGGNGSVNVYGKSYRDDCRLPGCDERLSEITNSRDS